MFGGLKKFFKKMGKNEKSNELEIKQLPKDFAA
jgi:hypothetical protein